MAAQDTSFARVVSLACHDLRTPLATVFGFARTLTRSQALGQPESGYAEMIEAASKQLAELIDELSVVARIESGRYDPRLEEVDTRELVGTAAVKLGEDRVTVSGTGGAVLVDRPAAERAVAALVQCALRHGGLEQVEASAHDGEVRVLPITPASAPVVLGQDLRDLGAAVAVRVVEHLGGAVAVEDGVLRISLPKS